MRMAEESYFNLMKKLKIALDSFTKEGLDERLVNLKFEICNKN